MAGGRRKKLDKGSILRGVGAIVVFLVIWEIGARSKVWLQWDSFTWLRELIASTGLRTRYLPWIGAVPAPTEVFKAFLDVVGQAGYWQSWYMSFQRVLGGFVAAMLIGIPYGLMLAVSRTQELAIMFITFLGAFYTIVINVVGGAQSIDGRFFQAAQSMGASKWDIFKRIVLPGTLPSIVVGSAVGMGITWEVVVAAEMISGGGSQMGGTGGGLGFFIWNSYVGGSYEQIVVGMISIGIAGFASSELLRWLGFRVTPWLRLR
jgi:NitT/TauT family transport system permease protein